MEKILRNLSVTKLAFMLMVLGLNFITGFLVIKWTENETLKTVLSLFSNVMIAMVSFYFGQKTIKPEYVDSLLDNYDHPLPRREEWRIEKTSSPDTTSSESAIDPERI